MASDSISSIDFLTALGVFDPGCDSLSASREEAFANLQASGFPGKKCEEWKYSSVQKIVDGGYQPAIQIDVDITPWSIDGVDQLVFINGHYSEELSNHSEALEVKDFSSVKTSDYLQNTEDPADAFYNLNRAFSEKGCHINLPAKTVLDKPVHILNLTSGCAQLNTPSFYIEIGSQSEAVFLESYVSDDEGSMTVPVTHVNVAGGAVFKHYKRVAEKGGFHIGKVQAEVNGDGRYENICFSTAGELVRNDLNVNLNSPGASLLMDGLYAAGDNELIDNHTEVRHMAPHTESRQLYKGLLAGRSRGVFNGKVYVEKDAQKADSAQLNKNMLLSKAARVDTKPELDVHADDIKAAHGATVGQLNEDELFYLKSRCIGESEAMSMLLHGYLDEIFEKVADEKFRQVLSDEFEEFLGRNAL